MASLVHTEEVQVADALELTAGHAVDSVLGEFCGLELGRVAVVEVVDNKLASVPVADPVCAVPPRSARSSCKQIEWEKLLTEIASPNENVDATLHDRLQSREERTGLITSGDNLGIRTSRALLVSRLSTDGCDNGVGLSADVSQYLSPLVTTP